VQGSYAEYAAVPAEKLVVVPDGVDLKLAAAVMLQGMTAHYLVHGTYPLRAGETAIVHAAAGGVGLLLVQMAKSLGARVIGTAGSQEKAQLARGAGADEVIVYTETDFETEAKRLLGGRGADVIYDGVGKSTFDADLNLLRPRGYLALFGASSGAVPPFDPIKLSQKGSLFLTRPTLHNYIATRAELEQRAGDLFAMMAAGTLHVRVHREYPLAEAAQAHRDLEGRKTTGKVLLIP
jgi:NADPH2:quinone reductase